MSTKTFRITFPAILAALSVILLLAGSLLPTGQLTMAALASIFVIAAMAELGTWGGIAVWAVTSLIGLLFLPDKTVPLLYAAFFGYYPVVKFFCEKLPNRVMEWACKLLCLNLAAVICIVIFGGTVVSLDMLDGRKWAAFLLVNLIFIVYDPVITWAKGFYSARISPKIRKG